jgi:hypothetical protein
MSPDLPTATSPHQIRGGVPVVVECFALQLRGGKLWGRLTSGPLDADPDRTAASLCGLLGSPLDGAAVLHSTSWRWEPPGVVVLTYVCCPDPAPQAHGTLLRPGSDHDHHDHRSHHSLHPGEPNADGAGRHRANDPSRPGADVGGPRAVLHHGIDHLAWLGDHHPQVVGAARAIAADLWAAIDRAGRHRAGRFSPHRAAS